MNKWCVYFFPERNKEEAAIKIGYSKDPIKRLKQLQTGHPDKLGCEGWWIVESEEEAKSVEKHLHELFTKDRKRKRGEWFQYSESIRNYLSANYSNSNFVRFFY